MKRNLLIWFTILSSLIGCVDDKSNTRIEELNEVTIGALQEKYSAKLGSYLQIPLPITTRTGDESQLSYAWYTYTPTTRTQADTLGKTKDLNAFMDPKILTPGEDYSLVVKITDLSTGVYYRKKMKLEVLSDFTKGTLLLCKENESYALHFMVDDAEKTFVKNIFEAANGTKLENPVRVYALNPNKYQPQMKEVLVLCENETGGYFLNPVSMKSNRTVESAITFSPETGIYSPQLHVESSSRSVDYLIISDQVFKRGTNMGAMTWDAPMVVVEGSTEYKIGTGMVQSSSGPAFYDELNGRILVHNNSAWNKAPLKQLKTETGDLNYFDCNNMGTNMEYLAGGLLSADNECWMLLRHKENQQNYLFKIKITSDNRGTSLAKIAITPEVAPHLQEATHFASLEGMKDLLFYSTGNSIYAIALSNLREGVTNNLEAQIINGLEDDFSITGMKLSDILVPDPTPENPLATKTTQQIRLYIQDQKISGNQKGGVAYYELGTVGGIHADPVYRLSGFCDQVIDVEEKYE